MVVTTQAKFIGNNYILQIVKKKKIIKILFTDMLFLFVISHQRSQALLVMYKKEKKRNSIIRNV